MFEEVLLQAQRPGPALGGGDGLMLALNLVSLGLLLALFVVFFGTWRKTRAPFTLGLMLFVGVLIFENLTHGLRLARLFQSPALFVAPEVLMVLALVVLLYLATR